MDPRRGAGERHTQRHLRRVHVLLEGVFISGLGPEHPLREVEDIGVLAVAQAGQGTRYDQRVEDARRITRLSSGRLHQLVNTPIGGQDEDRVLVEWVRRRPAGANRQVVDGVAKRRQKLHPGLLPLVPSPGQERLDAEVAHRGRGAAHDDDGLVGGEPEEQGRPGRSLSGRIRHLDHHVRRPGVIAFARGNLAAATKGYEVHASQLPVLNREPLLLKGRCEASDILRRPEAPANWPEGSPAGAAAVVYPALPAQSSVATSTAVESQVNGRAFMVSPSPPLQRNHLRRERARGSAPRAVPGNT